MAPNIERTGRLIRGIFAAGLMIAAWWVFNHWWWMGILLGGSGVFIMVEALRGWCALRACGIKTRF